MISNWREMADRMIIHLPMQIRLHYWWPRPIASEINPVTGVERVVRKCLYCDAVKITAIKGHSAWREWGNMQGDVLTEAPACVWRGENVKRHSGGAVVHAARKAG